MVIQSNNSAASSTADSSGSTGGKKASKLLGTPVTSVQSQGKQIDAAFIPPTHTTAPAPPTRPTRPPPPPPDPKLNGPNDYWALLPLTIIIIMTSFVLWQCAPGGQQWNPPVDHNSLFLSFEYPGRSLVGGAGSLSALSTGGPGAGWPASAGTAFMGHGGVTPGTRPWWQLKGRRNLVRSMGNILASHPLVIVAGPAGIGRTSVIHAFIDSTRGNGVQAQTTKGTSTTSPSTEYNAILYIDASSHSSIQSTFLQLHAFLRLHTLSFTEENVRSNIHAWLLKQERWLIVFENCQITKGELRKYAPLRGGGQTVVVLTTSDSSANDAAQMKDHLGFDLTAGDCIHVNPLPSKLGGRLLSSISGQGLGTLTDRTLHREIFHLMNNHTATTIVAALAVKKWQREIGVRELGEKLRLDRPTGSTPFSSLLFNMILPRVQSSLRNAGVTDEKALGVFLLLLNKMMSESEGSASTASSSSSSGLSVPTELLEVLLEPLKIQFPAIHPLSTILRELSSLNLLAENVQEICGERVVSVWFPYWFLRELDSVQVRLRQHFGIPREELIPSPAALSGLWVHLIDSEFLDPLITALGAPSASSYSIPTSSVVAANPQAIPPILRPYELYLSAFASIAEDPEGPLSYISPHRILTVLQATYGPGNKIRGQDWSSCSVAKATQWLGPVEELVKGSVKDLTPSNPNRSSLLPSSLHTILTLLGSFRLDILHDSPRALELFKLSAEVALVQQEGIKTVANPLLQIQSKNGLLSHSLMKQHGALLTLREVPLWIPFVSSLSLIGVTLACSQEGGQGSATATQLESRLYLDLAWNHIQFAADMKRIIFKNNIPLPDSIHPLHPSYSSSLSQLGHIHSLQRDLEGAKLVYGEALKLDQEMNFGTGIDAELRRTILSGPSAKNESGPSYTSSNNGARIFHPSAPRSRWELLIHQLKFIRDLSMLAHEESVLFYYSNALQLHERCYPLEAGLYTTDSTGAAARWLHIGHTHSAHQQPKDAHQFYESALEYHKSVLPDHADLRLVQSHFLSGRSHNSLGRGRAGRRALELSLDMKLLAIGGENHLGIVPQLETLGDTCYALGVYQDAITYYRRLLTLHQILLGESDSSTQLWKQKVLNLYQIIQQQNEEQKRKQFAAQQEQRRKIQEQREREQANQQQQHRASQQQKDQAKKDDL